MHNYFLKIEQGSQTPVTIVIDSFQKNTPPLAGYFHLERE
jgi:hypothetical protein